MLVRFTEADNKAFEALDEKYNRLIKEAEAEEERLQPGPIPETDYLFEGINADDNPAEWEAARTKDGELFSAWEAAGSAEWKAARRQRWAIMDQRSAEEHALFAAAERRQFAELGGDPKAILHDAKDQAQRIIISRYNFYKEEGRQKGYFAFSAIDVVALGGSEWKLDASEMRKDIIKSLYLHFDALAPYEELTAELNEHIISELSKSPYVAKEGTPGRGQQVVLREHKTTERGRAQQAYAIVSTITPRIFIEPLDKITQLTFADMLTGERLQEIGLESRGSKKKITTLAAISFDDLAGTVKFNGRKELTPYDREVYNAIVTLVEQGNDYMTPRTIYQTMTGNPDAIPAAQAEAIRESVTKLMYTQMTINGDEEAKAYGLEGFKYKGPTLHAEWGIYTLNGETLECLHIVKKPVLFDYAARKNQIGRIDIGLLRTPINKTPEIITLQGYLRRRIHAMRGSRGDKLSNNILYETVYEELSIKAATPGALREKKRVIRGHVKIILDYWKRAKWISEYTENKKGKKAYSVTISISR